MRQKILSNLSFNFLIRVIAYVFSFVELLYVTRILQPELFGRITFAASFSGYFVMLANLGMPIYATRACAEKRSDRKALTQLFYELWSIEVVLSLVSTVLFILTVLLVPSLRGNLALFSVYGIAILVQMTGCDWLYRGLEKFSILAIISFICKAISFIGILLFVRSPQNAVLYAVFSIVIAYGSHVACFVLRGKYVDRPIRFRLNPEHLKPLLLFFMMSFAVSVYTSLDLTMLGFMKSEFETGLYGVAAKGKNMLAITGSLVWGAILPTATKYWKDGRRARFEQLAAKSLVLVTVFQTFVALVCIIFAKQIIYISGGASYLDAAPSLRILLLSLPPIAVSNILGGQVLIPAGKERQLLHAELTGAVLNYIANLILIPYLSIIGAAITTVASEIVVCGFCIHYCKKELDMDFGSGLIRKTVKKLASVRQTLHYKSISVLKNKRLPYRCPCCHTNLNGFVDGGYLLKPELYQQERYVAIDQDVICPLCGSLPRHRILADWLQVHQDQLAGKDILYFAQEKAMRLWFKRNHITCTTADLYYDADLRVNIENTGIADEAYDVIFCNHVLEHVTDYRKALRELHRIVRKDGMVLLSFPVDEKLDTVYENPEIVLPEERIRHFGQYDHLRVFGRDSMQLLQGFGFTVTEISGNDEHFDQRIKAVVGPADYDYNVIWCLQKTNTI